MFPVGADYTIKSGGGGVLYSVFNKNLMSVININFFFMQ